MSSQPTKQAEAWVCNAGCGKKNYGHLPFQKNLHCCGQSMREPININSWINLECEHKNNNPKCNYTVNVPPEKKEYRCQGRERLGNNKVCLGWMVPPWVEKKTRNNFI